MPCEYIDDCQYKGKWEWFCKNPDLYNLCATRRLKQGYDDRNIDKPVPVNTSRSENGD